MAAERQTEGEPRDERRTSSARCKAEWKKARKPTGQAPTSRTPDLSAPGPGKALDLNAAGSGEARTLAPPARTRLWTLAERAFPRLSDLKLRTLNVTGAVFRSGTKFCLHLIPHL